MTRIKNFVKFIGSWVTGALTAYIFIQGIAQTTIQIMELPGKFKEWKKSKSTELLIWM